MKRVVFLLPCLLVLGCCKFKPEFVDVVQDHKHLSNETLTAVIATIEDDLQAEGSSLSPDDIQGINDLLERLRLLIKQSDAIEKYVVSGADAKTIAELLRNKWKEQ